MTKKWKFWKKVMQDKPSTKPVVNACVHCGKHVLRQSKLSEFGDMTGPLQSKLPIDFDEPMTESIGFNSKPRKYRGMI
jgi:hypothetical protein